MPTARKADVFAGPGSFAERLKQHRDAVESGDLEGANDAFKHAMDSADQKAADKAALDEERKKNQDGWQKQLTGEH